MNWDIVERALYQTATRKHKGRGMMVMKGRMRTRRSEELRLAEVATLFFYWWPGVEMQVSEGGHPTQKPGLMNGNHHHKKELRWSKLKEGRGKYLQLQRVALNSTVCSAWWNCFNVPNKSVSEAWKDVEVWRSEGVPQPYSQYVASQFFLI